jgi:toxin ParE1/3/4
MTAGSIHPEAELEIEAAADHYREIRPELETEFRIELETTLRRIQFMPAAFARFRNTAVRSLNLHRFPYVVYYLEVNTRPVILAVAHSGRRPGYWRRRQPDEV